PRTNVAESADVIKKMKIRINDNPLVIMPSGNSANIANNANSTSWFTNSEIPPAPFISTSNAVVPNVVNQISARTEGASKTPVTNSLIVRPLEIRAINKPTKGAQDICQAQKKIVLAPSHPLSFSGVKVKL